MAWVRLFIEPYPLVYLHALIFHIVVGAFVGVRPKGGPRVFRGFFERVGNLLFWFGFDSKSASAWLGEIAILAAAQASLSALRCNAFSRFALMVCHCCSVSFG